MRAAVIHSHQDVRSLNVVAVVEVHPIIEGRNDRAVQVEAHIDALAAAERDDICDDADCAPPPTGPTASAMSAAHPERIREELRDSLLRHDQGYDLGYRDARLEPDAPVTSEENAGPAQRPLWDRGRRRPRALPPRRR